MHCLYVLYDARCELCSRLKQWLENEESWLELKLLPAGSEQARNLFPALEEIASAEDLVAISDEGEVYLNNSAWIMCLYALVRYRDWAFRLAHPLLLPLARQSFAALSGSRHVLSRWLAASGPEAIEQELRRVSLRPCSRSGETIADYLR
jgi:predicted DCC family thiol-disulfide oxidoreductase YuxK